VPRLEQFTGGKLAERFETVETTNRGELMLDDIRIWGDHPVLGVGPGMVKIYRDELTGAGHTEFTRLVAEHGMFGFISLLILISMAIRTLLRPGSPSNRGHRVIFLMWALLSMLHAAMRIAAFGFFFGLAHAAFQLTQRRSSEVDGALI
jgi:hypothetical protein